MLMNEAFKRDFLEFEKKIRYYGYMKSLVMTTLKIMSPGIPDFYQGTEVWRYLLTDPDNRMPVDFNRLEKLITQLPNSIEKISIKDERTKMLLIVKLLKIKREEKLNDYKPLPYGFIRGKLLFYSALL